MSNISIKSALHTLVWFYTVYCSSVFLLDSSSQTVLKFHSRKFCQDDEEHYIASRHFSPSENEQLDFVFCCLRTYKSRIILVTNPSLNVFEPHLCLRAKPRLFELSFETVYSKHSKEFVWGGTHWQCRIVIWNILVCNWWPGCSLHWLWIQTWLAFLKSIYNAMRKWRVQQNQTTFLAHKNIWSRGGGNGSSEFGLAFNYFLCHLLTAFHSWKLCLKLS